MDSIECFNRYLEPLSMKSVYPIMSQGEKHKPPQQYSHVDNETPQECAPNHFNGHLFLLIAGYLRKEIQVAILELFLSYFFEWVNERHRMFPTVSDFLGLQGILEHHERKSIKV